MSSYVTYGDWKGWAAADFGRCGPALAHYFEWHTARALGPDKARAGASVLELGFGNGSYLGWARLAGLVCSGVELDAQAVTRARAAGFPAEANLADLPAGAQFDLVVAFDVLEHVPAADLPGLLSQLAGLLRPGGRMLLRFPNCESPLGLIYQFGDLTHQTPLGRSRMRQLCLTTGLNIVASGDRLPASAFSGKRYLAALVRAAAQQVMSVWLGRFIMGHRVDLEPNALVVLARRNA